MDLWRMESASRLELRHRTAWVYRISTGTQNNIKFDLFLCPVEHCCGSMTFWCGSGSADPCLWLMDPDPPSIFVINLQDANKKLIKTKKILLITGTFRRYIYIIFQRKKVKKKSKNSRNQGFSYYFCKMIEESGSVSRRTKNQGCGSGLDPDSIGSVYPDPGRQKWPTKVEFFL